MTERRKKHYLIIICIITLHSLAVSFDLSDCCFPDRYYVNYALAVAASRAARDPAGLPAGPGLAA